MTKITDYKSFVKQIMSNATTAIVDKHGKTKVRISRCTNCPPMVVHCVLPNTGRSGEHTQWIKELFKTYHTEYVTIEPKYERS